MVGFNGDNAKDKPVVSVIIPSYNSKTWIRKCLNAICSQVTQLPKEVIVVDSSDDGTDKIVANEFLEVRLFHFEKKLNAGLARNKGVEKAHGEFVFFLDTDCIVKPTWIDDLYKAIHDHKVDGVGGSVENGTPWSFLGSAGFYLEFFRFLPYKGKSYQTIFLMTGNAGFKREVFTNTKYPDLSLSEDFLFNWQLKQQGRILLFLPFVSVTHMNRTGLKQVFNYQYKLGKSACFYRSQVSPGTMRVFKKLPILSYSIPFAIMIWIGYIVLRRRGILEFLKFVILFPLLFLANTVWAYGFHKQLKDKKTI